MTTFWKRYEKLCKDNNESPNSVGKKLGMSSGSVSNWKSGSIPSGDTLVTIANYFNVTIDYLMIEESVDIKPYKFKETFQVLQSLPQRISVLRHGNEITYESYVEIANFTNCDPSFLFNADYQEFSPVDRERKESIKDYSPLEKIIGIMDRCADNQNMRNLQINLSRIALYWIYRSRPQGEKYDYNRLRNDREFRSVSDQKLDFLCKNITHIDPTIDYGFNLTELDAIREATGLSFLYMFTGCNYTENIDVGELITDKDKAISAKDALISEKDNLIMAKDKIIVQKDNRIAELEARIAELEKNKS